MVDSPRHKVPFARFAAPSTASINGPPEESVDDRPVPQSSAKRRLRDLWANRQSSKELLVLYWLLTILILLLITRLAWYSASYEGRTVSQFLTCTDRKWDLVDACSLNGFVDGPLVLEPGITCLQPAQRVCGLAGLGCLPFMEQQWMPIHCAESCMRSDVPVFGTGVYRADSVICAAAVHAGVIGATGGCAMMQMTGPQKNFTGSTQATVKSKSYNYSFPSSYSFRSIKDESSNCHSLSSTFILSTLVLVLGSVVLFRPSKLFLLGSLMFTGYWVVIVALDQSTLPDNRINNLSRDLPILAAAGGFIYYAAAEHAIYPQMTSSLPNIFFYVVPFMAGLSIKTISNWLQNDNPARKSNVGLLVVFLAPIGIVLVYHVWLVCKTTCLKRLAFTLSYMVIALFYLVTALVLRENFVFHFHHNTLALLLIPLTRWRNRPIVSITQALLVGTFVNGLALEGWETSFLRTTSGIKPLGPPRCFNSSDDSVVLTWHYDKSASPHPLGVALYQNYVEIDRQFFSGTIRNLTFEARDLSVSTHYEYAVSALLDQGLMGPLSTIVDCSTN